MCCRCPARGNGSSPAPAFWGSTYLITTETLPDGYPVTFAALRALPAGLLLLARTRCLSPRAWLGRPFLLGTFNFAPFWVLLFVAAYRLPGGVVATFGALQAMIVLGLARGWFGTPIRAGAVAAAATGVIGVALLLHRPGGRPRPHRHCRGPWRGGLDGCGHSAQC